jgi:hypothetical protein
MIIAAKTKYAARTVINQMKTALAVVQTEGKWKLIWTFLI